MILGLGQYIILEKNLASMICIRIPSYIHIWNPGSISEFYLRLCRVPSELNFIHIIATLDTSNQWFAMIRGGLAVSTI